MVIAPSTQTGRRLPAQAGREMKSHCLGDFERGKDRLQRQRRQRMFQPSYELLIKSRILRQGSGVQPVICSGETKPAFPLACLCGESYQTSSATDLAFWNDEKASKAAMVVPQPRHDSEMTRGVVFGTLGYQRLQNHKSPPVTLPRVHVAFQTRAIWK